MGSHFSSRFEGEKIPSLEEVLEACKGRIRLNIELKSIGTKSPLPEVVTEMIKEMGMEDQCVITSVSLDYLKRVKEAEPELKQVISWQQPMVLIIKMNLWILSASGPAL